MAKNQIMLDKREEEDVRKSNIHPNTPAEQEEVTFITTSMNEMRQLKEKTWRELNDRTLKEYIDDNEKRINTYVPPRSDDIDDWQAKGFEGITREQMLSFVAKIGMKRPDYKFKATRRDGFIDRTISETAGDFYEYSWLKEDPTELKFMLEVWDAAAHGAVIRHEGIEVDEYMEETFDSYDVSTGEMIGHKEKLIQGDINCMSRRPRLMDFYWRDWYQPDVQKQPEVAEELVLNEHEFQTMFGDYHNADKVVPVGAIKELYGESFFQSHWDSDDYLDKYVVTLYFSKSGGRRQYRVLCNGVLMLATPIPRKDGNYPYEIGIIEPFADSSFILGMALPHKIEDDEDVYNAIKNMVVDRSMLHVQRPLVSDKVAELEDDLIGPNRLLHLDGNVTTLDFDPPSQADMTVLDFLRNAAQRQTADAQQLGQVTGGATAREIVIADENARKLMGVARKFMEAFDHRCAKLRVSNILQFYFEPVKIQEIIDGKKQEDVALVYRTVSLEGKTLGDRKQGTRVVSIVGKRGDLPTQEELDIEEEMARIQGFELEKRVINAEYVKNFEVDMLLIPESTYQSGRSFNIAAESEYQQVVASLYPNKFVQHNEHFFRSLNEAYDKDDMEFSQPERGAQEEPVAAPAGAPEGELSAQLNQGQGPVPNPGTLAQINNPAQ